MSALPKVSVPPTVGIALTGSILEEPERTVTPSRSASKDHDDAVDHFMKGRSQHGAPRHFSFRPDSAGTDRNLGFQKHIAPIMAQNANLKEQIGDLTKRCESLLAMNETLKKANAQMEAMQKENGRLKLKVLDLDKALREVTERIELAAAGKV